MRITGILDPTKSLQASSLSSRKRSLSTLTVQLNSLHTNDHLEWLSTPRRHGHPNARLPHICSLLADAGVGKA